MNIETSSLVAQQVDALIQTAVMRKASDIHLEPVHNGLRIRYRIDGVLHDQETFSSAVQEQMLARVKVLASMPITQTRVPQDGKCSVRVDGRLIDIRVASFPSLYGQHLVLRILGLQGQIVKINELGMSQHIMDQFCHALASSTGFLLVTGPTGSGKTTTLYAALHYLNNPDKHIITLEDPVEHVLDGVTQGNINVQAGFTFEQGVRAMLRQDPDVVMLGEIRDQQTARVAIQAALAGHLMLSTVHTGDAAGALVRLIDMGIEPFLVNAAVSCIVSQRLARVICQMCRHQVEPTQDQIAMMHTLGIVSQQLYAGQGCASCYGLGYKGRIGIFELLVMSNAMRTLLMTKPVFDQVRAQACADGMQTMLVDGMHKVSAGIITLAELVSVVC